jgi:hypothetical protein
MQSYPIRSCELTKLKSISYLAIQHVKDFSVQKLSEIYRELVEMHDFEITILSSRHTLARVHIGLRNAFVVNNIIET